MKNIYRMKLHEITEVTPLSGIMVMRVPGGWIYTQNRLDVGVMTSCFVPFDNEFMCEPETTEVSHV